MQTAYEQAVQQFWSVGGTITTHSAGTLVRHDSNPTIRMGNFAAGIRTRDYDSINDLIGQTSKVVIDSETPSSVAAHLALNDWKLDQELQHAMPPSVEVPAATGLELSPVTGDDWETIYQFFRIDHVEEDARAKRETRPESLTRAGVELRRSIGAEATYYLATTASEPEACIATWENGRGIGIIEDVFVYPDSRGKGVAKNMLRFAVNSLRRDGVEHVLIASDIEDTPKRLYARFGFEPVHVNTAYVRAE